MLEHLRYKTDCVDLLFISPSKMAWGIEVSLLFHRKVWHHMEICIKNNNCCLMPAKGDNQIYRVLYVLTNFISTTPPKPFNGFC